MPASILDVQGLGKRYRLGESVRPTHSIREAISSSIGSAFRRMGQLFTDAAPGMGDTTFWALQDVSFSVEPGEVVGVIGRNGAGKSTLLKILSRITEPTQGRAVLQGRVGSLLEVGTGFHGELTGRENIYLSGAILGMTRKEIDSKFDAIVSFADVEAFVDTPIKRYSSGMNVRLGFAVAAHLEPEILLVDEVLAVGDAAFQRKCIGKMEGVARSGRTILFVSHNMGSIQALCTRVIVLDKGQILHDGDIEGGIAAYQHSIEQRTGLPIGERTDRIGEGKVRVEDLRILDGEGRPCSSIPMGSDLTVELTISGSLPNAIVGVMIGDHLRGQLLRGYTYEQVTSTVDLDGRAVVRCTFRGLPLIHGEYFLHTWIGQGVKGGAQVQDAVEQAARFEVMSADVFQTGKELPRAGYLLYCPVDWSVDGANLS